MSNDGTVLFGIFLGDDAPAGTYTIVAEARFGGFSAVIGPSVAFEVE